MAFSEAIEKWGALRIDNPTRIGVVGNGAREHSLLAYMKELADARGEEFQGFALPGNGGTPDVATNIDVLPTEIDKVVNAVHDNGIQFVVIGPERPMAMGLTDALEESGIQVFGHRQDRMWLESSKSQALEFMIDNKIPHPDSRVITSIEQARALLEKGVSWGNIVVKDDGLREGKGVTVTKSQKEALKITEEILGAEGGIVVWQDELMGPEISMMGFVSNEMGFLLPAKDFKTLRANGQGPNTGGMGAYAPNEAMTAVKYEEFIEKFAIPTKKGMAKLGLHLTGEVYWGLMDTPEGLRLLEFNMRFGDPEIEVLLALFRGDLLKIMQDTRNGTLDSRDVISSHTQAAAGVFLASEGYPENPITGREITGIYEASQYADLYHGGTRREGQRLKTDGGRVILAVRAASSVDIAADRAYEAVDQIIFDGKQVNLGVGSEVLLP
jgi:phosphoribosylamine---glycine ligase